MRTVFLGSSEFSVASLEAMVGAGWTPDLVVSPQAKPSGRGLRRRPSPVSIFASTKGLSLREVEDVNAPATLEAIREARPDLGVLVSYGQILRREVLGIPAQGWINVHASLLPRHRGASPIASAILAGDAATGVTLLRVVRRMDAGPMLAWRETSIGPRETAGELSRRLAVLGGELLVATLEDLGAGRAVETPQDEARATYCGKIAKASGAVRWDRPAVEIDRHVRAMTPWPGAWSLLGDPRKGMRRWALLAVRPAGGSAGAPRESSGDGAAERSRDEPGTILVDAGRRRLLVRVGKGEILEILRLRVEGRRAMDAAAFLRGSRLASGAVLRSPPAEAGRAG